MKNARDCTEIMRVSAGLRQNRREGGGDTSLSALANPSLFASQKRPQIRRKNDVAFRILESTTKIPRTPSAIATRTKQIQQTH